jgi:hypothetical protein
LNFFSNEKAMLTFTRRFLPPNHPVAWALNLNRIAMTIAWVVLKDSYKYSEDNSLSGPLCQTGYK